MKRGTKHGIGEFLMLAGFLSVIPGSLVAGISTLDTKITAGLGLGGFIVFIIGVEIYLRTRKDPSEVDVSNTGSEKF